MDNDFMKRFLALFLFTCVIALTPIISFPLFAQTLIINEMSNGPSGNQEYIEFLVIDNTVSYNCNSTTPPCIDIRGWIFDDNSGYHGTGGVAAGAARFSYNPLWACVPLGTIILVYNNQDPNVNLPVIDLSLTDGNCRIVAPINNTSLFESNMSTPGAVACSYPNTGWVAGGNWTFTVFANPGDCGRIVDLSGCEVFSMCYGTCNTNNLIYFPGAGGQNNWFFNDGNPLFQFNWTEGTATAGGGNETPGYPNNAANAAYIAQFNNGCVPITPLVTSSASTNTNCGCTGSATITASGSIAAYSYKWLNSSLVTINQNTATATNLCSGTYYGVTTSSIGCTDTVTVTISDIGASSTTTQNVSVCFNDSYIFPDASSAVITANTSHQSTLTNISGCDSVITTQVSVILTTNSTASLSVCANTSVTFPDGSSQIITANTVQASTLSTLAGCDSTITTTVTIVPAITTTQNISVCPNTNYVFPDGSASIIVATTTQQSTLVSTLGCDSIITSIVSVYPALQTQLSQAVCFGENVTLPDGTTATNVQTNFSFSATYAATNGCDSVVTTSYVIVAPISVSQTVTICSGQSITYPDGTVQNSVTTNLTHISTLVSALGCDSVITTNVVVKPNYAITVNKSLCIGTNYTFPDGSSSVIQNNGNQTSNLLSLFGCDSVVTTNYTAISSTTLAIYDTICQGDSYTFPNGSTQNSIQASLLNTTIITNSLGCDSIITTNLTVLNQPNAAFSFLPTIPTVDDNTVIFSPIATQATYYNWTLTDANQTVLTTTNDTLFTYAFSTDEISPFSICLTTLSDEGCAATLCQSIAISKAISVFIPNAFTPNKNLDNELFLPIITGSPFENYTFKIFNRWGQLIFNTTTYPYAWDGTHLGEPAPNDVYIYKVNFKEQNSIKEYNFVGHVTIIR